MGLRVFYTGVLPPLAAVVLFAASPRHASRSDDDAAPRDSGRGIVHVAVAANFSQTAAALAERFEAGTGHRVVASVGSTGQLYSQILNGAPFEVFLAADTLRPALLERSGAADQGDRFTYAEGRLALLSSRRVPLPSIEAVLGDASNRRIAIANPATAPYGMAAMQVLEKTGLRSALRERLVRGESIAQTLQFVRSGAAELGLVAYSQVIRDSTAAYLLVADSLHDPIAQDAVLLRSGSTNPAARAYFDFLRGDVAKRMIREFGYGVR